MNTYYLTFRFKLIHIISGILLSIPFVLLLLLTRKIPVFNIIFLIFLGITIVNTIIWIKKENIEISEKEIKYEGPDLAFRAKWEHIEKIALGWYFPVRTEGLFIESSLIRTTKIAIISVKRFPFWVHSKKSFIPLSCFSANWRDTELGQQIKRYAPHLFEKEKSA